MPRKRNPATLPIWCDHCNTYITPAAVKGCLRLTCTTKTALAERNRQLGKTAP